MIFLPLGNFGPAIGEVWSIIFCFASGLGSISVELVTGVRGIN